MIVTGFLLNSQAQRSSSEARIAYMAEISKIAEQLNEQTLSEKRRFLELKARLQSYNEKNDPTFQKRSEIFHQMDAPQANPTASELERSPEYVRVNEVYNEAKSNYDIAEWLSFRLSLGGVVVAFLGFYLWYDRIQRHLDKQLTDSVSSSDNANQRSRDTKLRAKPRYAYKRFGRIRG
jgi:hypothetical protein